MLVPCSFTKHQTISIRHSSAKAATATAAPAMPPAVGIAAAAVKYVACAPITCEDEELSVEEAPIPPMPPAALLSEDEEFDPDAAPGAEVGAAPPEED